MSNWNPHRPALTTPAVLRAPSPPSHVGGRSRRTMLVAGAAVLTLAIVAGAIAYRPLFSWASGTSSVGDSRAASSSAGPVSTTAHTVGYGALPEANSVAPGHAAHSADPLQSKPAPPPGVLPESNRRMAARLQAQNELVEAEFFSYRNGEFADLLKRRLAVIAAGGAPHRPPLQTHVHYIYQLLLAGRTREAIDHQAKLEKALKEQNVVLPEAPRKELDEIQAISYFRLGEQENCLQRHCCYSCIFPLQRDAVHEMPEGSENAIQAYTALLKKYPDNLSYRWLLNLAYQTLGKYPQEVPQQWLIPPKGLESEYPLPRFQDVATDVGLADIGLAGGVCMDDFDGDGLLDIVKTTFDISAQMKYFHNNGDGTFSDRTPQSLLTGQVGGLNVTHVDFDNDGHLDLFVLRGGWINVQGSFPNSLLRNRGDGTFEDVTEQAGVLSFHPTQVAAWGDYDNDGWLDVFIGNESSPEDPHLCELYRNNRDGTFTNVAAQMGLAIDAFVKGAAWGDYDNDGRLDLYVSTMGSPNMLFHNDGNKFSDATVRAGNVSEPIAGFPCWFFDFDNDGWLDILAASFLNSDTALEPFVKEYLGQPVGDDIPKIHLYRNRRNGTFEDISKRANISRPMMAMGANFGDLDNDGWQDMYFGTGNPRFSALLPNRMFRNDGGRAFQDVTTAGGFGHLQKGHGVAFGDIDNDGDQDVYIVLGGAYTGDIFRSVLFENPGNKNHWLTLRFRGEKSNRYGVGARVRILVADESGSQREIHRVVGETGSFGSNTMQMEVGLGACARIVKLDVHWPVTGKTDSFTDVPLDQCLFVTEGHAELRRVPLRKIKLGGSTAVNTPIVLPTSKPDILRSQSRDY